MKGGLKGRKVFLSHVSEDELRVKQLHAHLTAERFDVWLDSEGGVEPGDEWRQKIEAVMHKVDFVIVCLSKCAITKSGPFQREIRIALEIADEKPWGAVFLIPCRLEECEIPGNLIKFHVVDLFNEDGSLHQTGYEQLKEKLSKDGDRSYLSRPGDPVPFDAKNYVERGADQGLIGDLEEDGPFTMIVRGPVHCGKSSLLARLEHEGRVAGVETAWFDPRLPIGNQGQDSQHQSDINTRALLVLAQQLQAQWGIDPPGQQITGSIPNVYHSLLKALEPTAAKPRLLILDDLASLGTLVADEWLSLLVRALTNKRGALHLNLSIAVGFTHQFGPSFSRKLWELSSIVHWHPRIDLGWFSRDEVARLVKQTTGGASVANDLYDLFGGQPYLTHAALTDTDFRDSVRDWVNDPSEVNARPVRGALPYRQHVHAVRLAILGPALEVRDDVRSLLRSFIDACGGEVPKNADDRLFLEMAKLLDKNGKPALKIYSLIAEDLGEFIGR